MGPSAKAANVYLVKSFSQTLIRVGEQRYNVPVGRTAAVWSWGGILASFAARKKAPVVILRVSIQ